MMVEATDPTPVKCQSERDRALTLFTVENDRINQLLEVPGKIIKKIKGINWHVAVSTTGRIFIQKIIQQIIIITYVMIQLCV